MRILFLGDIVGDPGVELVRTALPGIIVAEVLDLVIANAENASGGTGMSPRIYRQLREAGVDLITMGDHVYKKLEITKVFRPDEPICRPANFPPEAPGARFAIAHAKDGTSVAAFCVLGRTYMRPVDCPFRAADAVLSELKEKAAIVIADVHAEATADKYLLGRYLDGRVAAVIGTHTHVPTADEQIFPGGTAFVCDAGMCGPYDSILGRRVDRVLSAALSFVPTAFDVAEKDVRLSGAIVDVDPATGKAQHIRRFHHYAASSSKAR
jgi:metallophosphoesterase (TIGR00282 family)